MADRITQLQDALNQLCKSPGSSVTVMDHASTGGGSGVTQEGHAALFATLISRTAKDIDFLIESLPSEECSSALQKLLESIQQALSEIAESRLSNK
ncbi:Mediator of RNA polymerase II transcription subunit 21 [Acropora cervicornis]|uniref:Mediator of RNA polymerase II transcription subunit 21 n=1 Tax=Acropora cervicornis TaxID=6130 RepID=A0AAD9Q823_ACRCE|nr:Mediator of RNA polymerase II transcription subunit 21 [Acropora cervicornis]